MPDVISLVVILPIILLALTVHEYAHAVVANSLGDPTPRWHGRLTLNPLAHLDLIGTLMLIITQRFGWAKPVPINPAHFRDWRKGIMLVGVAGPFANVSLAFVFALPIRFGVRMSPGIEFIVNIAVWINLGLAAFNLIPIPPLDGSKLLMGILRGRQAYTYARLEVYGPFILMAVIIMGVTGWLILPVVRLLYWIVTGIYPFY